MKSGRCGNNERINFFPPNQGLKIVVAWSFGSKQPTTGGIYIDNAGKCDSWRAAKGGDVSKLSKAPTSNKTNAYRFLC
jgi:hypothetical protein